MVLAILEDRKGQTRRIAKPQPPHWEWTRVKEYAKVNGLTFKLPGQDYWIKPCPYGAVGDRLWVRETWAVAAHLNTVAPSNLKPRRMTVVYREGGHACNEDDGWTQFSDSYSGFTLGKWRPSFLMPRWASRITLEITDVRMQRLRGISEEDAMAEGVNWKHYAMAGISNTKARKLFRELWESINGVGSWMDNPWVWAISFRRIKQ
jgi:hypothetical protein